MGCKRELASGLLAGCLTLNEPTAPPLVESWLEATLGPGFRVDEDVEHLGESLILPPAFEHLRSQVEPILTPLPDPRPWATASR